MLPAAAMVLLAGAPVSTLLFDPMSPRVTAAELRSPAQVIAWWFYYANSLVLVLNLLLPMLPFDLGRIILAITRRRGGAMVASAVVLRVGLVSALAVLVLASTLDQTRIIAVAAVGALATWLEHRRLGFMADPLARAGEAAMSMGGGLGALDDRHAGAADVAGPASRLPSPRRQSEAGAGTRGDEGADRAPDARPGVRPSTAGENSSASAAASQRPSEASRPPGGEIRGGSPPRDRAAGSPALPLSLDEVLAKISRGGLASLSDAERAFLARETERRRGG
jgi:hypothetical protein